MTYGALYEAIVEAERFLQRAKKLRLMVKDSYQGLHSKTYLSYGSDSSAVRRASMDLTRALARLRRY
jgi:hypothetical protein